MKYSDSHAILVKFGRDLLNHTSLEQGLPMISEYAKKIINADRCSIYIYDKENNKVWTTLNDSIDKLVLSADHGIVGKTIKDAKALRVDAPYNHKDFNEKVDHQTGYTTQNIATAPIFDSSHEIIGVLQLLNKQEDDFDDDDMKFMIFFSHYISGYLELSIQFK